MRKLALSLVAAAVLAFGVESEPAGAPPTDVEAGLAGVLQKDGVRVKDGAKNVMEVWFRQTAPKGEATSESNVSLTHVPHGSLIGVARFPEAGKDRRGQTVKPGLYTLRLSFFPPDGNHQGVSEQRDFLVLSPVSVDKDVNAAPAFEALMDMSRKGSGTPHPLVLSAWKADEAKFKAGVAKEGEHDYVLQHKIGELPLAVIVSGTVEH
ncbi:MAG TPA: hypothetical protein VES20_09805 [Bryobacteraceae bacterium]|nr:hypothetical protein [Bryobacteraceae bacterium]